MTKNLNPIGAFIKAVSFFSDKHRAQRRKDGCESLHVTPSVALDDVLTNEAGVPVGKSLGKRGRQQSQIEYAPHSLKGANLVDLPDNIYDPRDSLASPPTNWPSERKHVYVARTTKVASIARSVPPGLEAMLNVLLASHVELR